MRQARFVDSKKVMAGAMLFGLPHTDYYRRRFQLQRVEQRGLGTSAFEELGNRNFEEVCELAESCDTDVAFAAFDGTGKRTPQAARVGKVLLGEPALFPQRADTLAEILSDRDRVLHSSLI